MCTVSRCDVRAQPTLSRCPPGCCKDQHCLQGGVYVCVLSHSLSVHDCPQSTICRCPQATMRRIGGRIISSGRPETCSVTGRYVSTALAASTQACSLL